MQRNRIGTVLTRQPRGYSGAWAGEIVPASTCLAAFSGLRHTELLNVTPGDLNLTGDRSTVPVRAAFAKNGRQNGWSLPPKIAEHLAA
ncbi:MAG: hypothetical protein ACUVTW_08110 [Thermogutta sp.]